MGGVRADLTGEQVAHDDALHAAVLDDEVEHLVAGAQGDGAGVDLAQEGLRGGDLELLAGLPTRVVRAGDLDAAERAGGELAAVLAGERRADRVHVVDDADGLLAEAEGVGLASAEVAALDGVDDEPVDGVVVDLAGAGRVDAALGGDGVRAARGVVVRERVDVVAELTEGSGRASAGEAGADDDDAELATVVRVDELVGEAASLPRCAGVALGDAAVEDRSGLDAGDGAVRGFERHDRTPVVMAMGRRMLPTRTTSATRPATITPILRSRRPVPPRSETTVQMPCARWTVRTRSVIA